jgi:flagellar motor switch protein FliG
MSRRSAEEIQQDLEQTFTDLRATEDHSKRKMLLKKLRELIAEAENRTDPPTP